MKPRRLRTPGQRVGHRGLRSTSCDNLRAPDERTRCRRPQPRGDRAASAARRQRESRAAIQISSGMTRSIRWITLGRLSERPRARAGPFAEERWSGRRGVAEREPARRSALRACRRRPRAADGAESRLAPSDAVRPLVRRSVPASARDRSRDARAVVSGTVGAMVVRQSRTSPGSWSAASASASASVDAAVELRRRERRERRRAGRGLLAGRGSEPCIGSSSMPQLLPRTEPPRPLLAGALRLRRSCRCVRRPGRAAAARCRWIVALCRCCRRPPRRVAAAGCRPVAAAARRLAAPLAAAGARRCCRRRAVAAAAGRRASRRCRRRRPPGARALVARASDRWLCELGAGRSCRRRSPEPPRPPSPLAERPESAARAPRRGRVIETGCRRVAARRRRRGDGAAKDVTAQCGNQRECADPLTAVHDHWTLRRWTYPGAAPETPVGNSHYAYGRSGRHAEAVTDATAFLRRWTSVVTPPSKP